MSRAPVYVGPTGKIGEGGGETLQLNDLEGTVFTETVGPDDLEHISDPEEIKEYVIRAHISGHIGAGEMVRLIKSSKRVIWDNMFRNCQEHVSSCIQCQRYNIGSHGYHPPKNLQALLPFDHLERAIRTIADAIYKRLDGLNSSWDEYLPTTQYYMNTRMLELHGSSPYSLLFARRPNDWADYRTDKEHPMETDVEREEAPIFECDCLPGDL